MPGKCSFNINWLKKPLYEKWLMRDEDQHKARCSLCCKSFDISNMGEAALTSHGKSKKHMDLLKSSSLSVKNFFHNASSSTSNEGKVTNPPKNQSSNSILQVAGNDVLSAEILWALKVITSHFSYNSCKDINLLMQKMFPDSIIAKQFTCADKKCAYLCCFGIAPYFKSLLTQNVKQQDGFVLLFDETLNIKLQVKQMDYYVRIWENDAVVTKYIDSSFLGHATAEEMLEKMNTSSINGLPMANVLQLSMDGPSVNWKFFELFQQQLKSNYDCSSLNTGSCGLHIVNGAFKVGCEASEWKVKTLLSNLYFHFHDSPARREDFSQLTNSTIFPLQFCPHRWVENVIVAERALKIWDNVLNYVDAVLSGKLKNPKNKSFEILKISASDLLMPAKIACFQSVASIFQVFLLKYQTDKPMLPFLLDDLLELLKNLLVRFLKPDILSKCTTIKNYLDLDLSDTSSHLTYHKIDVGFSASKMVKSLKKSQKISDRQYMEYKLEAKHFLIAASKKFLEKCPLRFSIVRDISCLNPKRMENKDMCVTNMKNILNVLVQNKKIAEHICDNVIFQFRSLLDEANCTAELKHFSNEVNRIDSVLYGVCKDKDCYKDLWKVLQKILLLSHGQASVERGFSVNRQVEVENLKQESIVSQRIIIDHVRSVGGILKVDITKGLLLSAASAKQKYNYYLAEQKNKNESKMTKKRKEIIHEEINLLKKQKKNVDSDIKELLKSADNFAEEAEKSRNFSMITKSNSLRKTAKEKQETIKAIEIKLDAKLQELKNI